MSIEFVIKKKIILSESVEETGVFDHSKIIAHC
jgi:hypothetical protein